MNLLIVVVVERVDILADSTSSVQDRALRNDGDATAKFVET